MEKVEGASVLFGEGDVLPPLFSHSEFDTVGDLCDFDEFALDVPPPVTVSQYYSVHDGFSSPVHMCFAGCRCGLGGVILDGDAQLPVGSSEFAADVDDMMVWAAIVGRDADPSGPPPCVPFELERICEDAHVVPNSREVFQVVSQASSILKVCMRDASRRGKSRDRNVPSGVSGEDAPFSSPIGKFNALESESVSALHLSPRYRMSRKKGSKFKLRVFSLLAADPSWPEMIFPVCNLPSPREFCMPLGYWRALSPQRDDHFAAVVFERDIRPCGKYARPLYVMRVYSAPLHYFADRELSIMELWNPVYYPCPYTSPGGPRRPNKRTHVDVAILELSKSYRKATHMREFFSRWRSKYRPRIASQLNGVNGEATNLDDVKQGFHGDLPSGSVLWYQDVEKFREFVQSFYTLLFAGKSVTIPELNLMAEEIGADVVSLSNLSLNLPWVMFDPKYGDFTTDFRWDSSIAEFMSGFLMHLRLPLPTTVARLRDSMSVHERSVFDSLVKGNQLGFIRVGDAVIFNLYVPHPRKVILLRRALPSSTKQALNNLAIQIRNAAQTKVRGKYKKVDSRA